MCIIVAKKRGLQLPGKETLRNCFNYNSDGAGLMYNYGGEVHIEKGFMDFNSFYKRLTELDERLDLTQSDLALHFRISTSGLVDKGNCHPYPISTETDQLRNLKLTTDIGMVHNGIIQKHIPEPKSVLNDTQTFIKNFVHGMYQANNQFLALESNLKALGEEAGSKLCFIDKDGMYVIGQFIEEKDGILYSNSSYENYNYTYSWDYDILNGDFDVFDIEGISLTVEEFTKALGKFEYISEDTVRCVDGSIFYNNSDLVMDKDYHCLFELDYKNLAFNYLGDIDYPDSEYYYNQWGFID